MMPVRYQGNKGERYWEVYLLFAAKNQEEADRLYDSLHEALGCVDEDHDCPHFRFSSLRPLDESG